MLPKLSNRSNEESEIDQSEANSDSIKKHEFELV